MSWWVTFSDGSAGCVDVEPDTKALDKSWQQYNDDQVHRVAEKAIELKPGLQVAQIQVLPYPAEPRLNRIDSCPAFCMSPKRCAGRSSCPRDYACSE